MSKKNIQSHPDVYDFTSQASSGALQFVSTLPTKEDFKMLVKQTLLLTALLTFILKVTARENGGSLLGASLSINPDYSGESTISLSSNNVNTGIKGNSYEDESASLGVDSGDNGFLGALGNAIGGAYVGGRPAYSNGANSYISLNSESQRPASLEVEVDDDSTHNGSSGLSLQTGNGSGLNAQATSNPDVISILQVQGSGLPINSSIRASERPELSNNLGLSINLASEQSSNIKGSGNSNSGLAVSGTPVSSYVAITPAQNSLSIENSRPLEVSNSNQINSRVSLSPVGSSLSIQNSSVEPPNAVPVVISLMAVAPARNSLSLESSSAQVSNPLSVSSNVVSASDRNLLNIYSSSVKESPTVKTGVYGTVGSSAPGVESSVNGDLSGPAIGPKNNSIFGISLDLQGALDRTPESPNTIKVVDNSNITQIALAAGESPNKTNDLKIGFESVISGDQPDINEQVLTNSVNSQASPSVLSLDLNSGANSNANQLTASAPSLLSVNSASNLQKASGGLSSESSLGGTSGRVSAIPLLSLSATSQNIDGSIHKPQNPPARLAVKSTSLPSTVSVQTNAGNGIHASSQLNNGPVQPSQLRQDSTGSLGSSSVLSLGTGGAITSISGLTSIINSIRPNLNATSSGTQNSPSGLNAALSLDADSGHHSAIPVSSSSSASQKNEGSIHIPQGSQLGLTINTKSNYHPGSSVHIEQGNANNAAHVTTSLTGGQESVRQSTHQNSVSIKSSPSAISLDSVIPAVRPTSSNYIQGSLGGLGSGISIGGSSRYKLASSAQTSPITSHRIQAESAKNPQHSHIGLDLSNGVSSKASSGSDQNHKASLSLNLGNTGYTASKSDSQDSLNLSLNSPSISSGVSQRTKESSPNQSAELHISSSGTNIGSSLAALVKQDGASSLSLGVPAQSNSRIESSVDNSVSSSYISING
ncbi:hypothetical protein QAD02_005797 [Eretmocerus hayati]|uniref:Uncharacterized protein n=1 Tax=Eretmocerus hayati TaxID=131215 RepID=A0ACC2NYB2_9HYME|nr:hypothetical protein QAD02_005797 [Eretmocerus hayati]